MQGFINQLRVFHNKKKFKILLLVYKFLCKNVNPFFLKKLSYPVNLRTLFYECSQWNFIYESSILNGGYLSSNIYQWSGVTARYSCNKCGWRGGQSGGGGGGSAFCRGGKGWGGEVNTKLKLYQYYVNLSSNISILTRLVSLPNPSGSFLSTL